MDSYYPDLWSRYDWVHDSQADGGVGLYYCQVEYAAADEATATANASADHGDISGGCNGFSWAQLISD